MGLFQNLIDSYDLNTDSIGIIPLDEHGNQVETKTLLPIFHTTFKSEISITIDSDGSFVEASRDNKPITIIIPCTESSSGRSSGIAAHPLFDQLDYVGGFNEDKTSAYLEGLGLWKDEDELLNAVYTYINNKTIMRDLTINEIFKETEFAKDSKTDADRQIDTSKIRKLGVRFAVKQNGKSIYLFESKELQNTWITHINSIDTNEEKTFDYLSGNPVSKIASNHPKNINSITGNAKLLSCNDTSGFTFRGRFAKQDDAIVTDYTQSQKMHQMLKWIITNYGYRADTQVIITWAVDNNLEVKEKAYIDTFELFSEMEEIKTQTDVLEIMRLQTDANYAKQLRNLLDGYGKAERIKKHATKICIAIFDAATPGRMGLLFYQELSKNEYLERIVDWHIDASYYMSSKIMVKDDSNKDKYTYINYIGAPSFEDILFAVYGKSRGDKSYDTLRKKVRKQLFECMFGNFPFPRNMVFMAANRASNPMSFTDSRGKFSYYDWKRAINISCALFRKYYKETTKEVISMSVDEKRTERDYLYGRLLAVADRLEGTALYKSGSDRPTNAIKLMNAFQIKPYSTWGQLYTQLIPYKNQLQGAYYYQSIIDSIMVTFKEGEFEDNTPLSPLYLLGYSAQNKAMQKVNKKDENNENMEEEQDDIE